MIGAWLLTFLSTCGAAVLALGLGLLGGSVGQRSQNARSLLHLLTEARGALFTFLLATILLHLEIAPTWCIVSLSVGLTQATTIASIVSRRASVRSSSKKKQRRGSPPDSVWLHHVASQRGAVSAAVALCAVHVVALEAFLAVLDTHTPLELPMTGGGLLTRNLGASTLLSWLFSAALLFGLELLAGRILKDPPRSSRKFEEFE